jgi:IS5 family transposase
MSVGSRSVHYAETRVLFALVCGWVRAIEIKFYSPIERRPPLWRQVD